MRDPVKRGPRFDVILILRRGINSRLFESECLEFIWKPEGLAFPKLEPEQMLKGIETHPPCNGSLHEAQCGEGGKNKSQIGAQAMLEPKWRS